MLHTNLKSIKKYIEYAFIFFVMVAVFGFLFVLVSSWSMQKNKITNKNFEKNEDTYYGQTISDFSLPPKIRAEKICIESGGDWFDDRYPALESCECNLFGEFYEGLGCRR